jgi:hypothetical protein
VIGNQDIIRSQDLKKYMMTSKETVNPTKPRAQGVMNMARKSMSDYQKLEEELLHTRCTRLHPATKEN